MSDSADQDGRREHERRFLVHDKTILNGAEGYEIEQGYIYQAGGWAIRARRISRAASPADERDDVSAFLTAKGPRDGFSRPEYEMVISAADAASLIATTPHIVTKTRYQVISEREAWDIDVFHGTNSGLVIAELEASPAVLLKLRAPWWAGSEVTSDAKFQNENLAAHPVSKWDPAPSFLI